METTITVTVRTVRRDQPDIVDTSTRKMHQTFQQCSGDRSHGDGCGSMYVDQNFDKCPVCGAQLVCFLPPGKH